MQQSSNSSADSDQSEQAIGVKSPENSVLVDSVFIYRLAAYLAESFPGVPVSSAQAHHHVHSKTPHHVVLQIPVRRGRMLKETLSLTQSYDISAMGEQLFPLHAGRSRLHKHTLADRLSHTNTDTDSNTRTHTSCCIWSR